MQTVLYLLACYGLTFVVCDAKIFSRPRDWLRSRSTFLTELLDCHFCSGFWASMAMSIPFYSTRQQSIISRVEWTVVYGLAGASFCYALDTAIQWFERPTGGPHA